MLIKINSAGLLRFLLRQLHQETESWLQLACCCVQAAGKLNKQWCLFITRDTMRAYNFYDAVTDRCYGSMLLFVHVERATFK